jgi:hypothetical protein
LKAGLHQLWHEPLGVIATGVPRQQLAVILGLDRLDVLRDEGAHAREVVFAA